MFGLRSRMKKEKLLKNYKRLMREASIFKYYDQSKSKEIIRKAELVLDQIEQLD